MPRHRQPDSVTFPIEATRRGPKYLSPNTDERCHFAFLNAIDQGDPHAADQLLPLVYDDLRKLAAKASPRNVRSDASSHRTRPRSVHPPGGPREGPRLGLSQTFLCRRRRGSPRRILIENARYKQRLKHGGDRVREPEAKDFACPESPERLGFRMRPSTGWQRPTPRLPSWSVTPGTPRGSRTRRPLPSSTFPRARPTRFRAYARAGWCEPMARKVA